MSIRWLLVGLCSLAVILIVFGTVNARADVVEPGCEPVESWALTIDPDDRWHPDAARQGFWLPAQFEGETFETLFAVPAAEWTLDDVKTVGSLLRSCAKDARKAKRTDAEKAFHRARSFVTGNLRNYIRRTNRASARLDKRVGNLLELPTTPALLQVLAVLRELRAGDNDALRQAQRNLGQIGGQEARTARRIVQSAFRQTPEAYAADPLPQIEDRYQELRIGFLDEAESAIADHPAGSAGLAAIDTALTEIREELGGGLLTEDYAHLE
ncbi:MAG TPA: hypothetical protein VKA18_05615, partial [Alphaproteobacteria bacterium]|nr:hypothetical protein [Alphaproteobacteria bacterium]